MDENPYEATQNPDDGWELPALVVTVLWLIWAMSTTMLGLVLMWVFQEGDNLWAWGCSLVFDRRDSGNREGASVVA